MALRGKYIGFRGSYLLSNPHRFQLITKTVLLHWPACTRYRRVYITQKSFRYCLGNDMHAFLHVFFCPVGKTRGDFLSAKIYDTFSFSMIRDSFLYQDSNVMPTIIMQPVYVRKIFSNITNVTTRLKRYDISMWMNHCKRNIGNYDELIRFSHGQLTNYIAFPSVPNLPFSSDSRGVLFFPSRISCTRTTWINGFLITVGYLILIDERL